MARTIKVSAQYVVKFTGEYTIPEKSLLAQLSNQQIERMLANGELIITFDSIENHKGAEIATIVDYENDEQEFSNIIVSDA